MHRLARFSWRRVAQQPIGRDAARLMTARFSSTQVYNEPVLEYARGSDERQQLEEALEKYGSTTTDVPIVIGDQEIRSGDPYYQLAPFDRSKRVAKYYHATPQLIEKAIAAALAARVEWERKPLADRAQVYFRAADLLAGKYRMDINSATMLGQGML